MEPKGITMLRKDDVPDLLHLREEKSASLRPRLRILLRGKQPVIWCPARSIDGMVIRRELRPSLDEGRLLILSPFEEKHRRQSAELAAIRNRFVAAVADSILIAYASPGGKIEDLAREAWTWKPLYTFASPYNEALVMLCPPLPNADALLRSRSCQTQRPHHLCHLRPCEPSPRAISAWLAISPVSSCRRHSAAF
ncbi:MAG TPA: hypothetical protein VM223_15130 [Planctomycetota bacterium]|nr:hypothetical protein [Planctomycetota bacterium]